MAVEATPGRISFDPRALQLNEQDAQLQRVIEMTQDMALVTLTAVSEKFDALEGETSALQTRVIAAQDQTRALTKSQATEREALQEQIRSLEEQVAVRECELSEAKQRADATVTAARTAKTEAIHFAQTSINERATSLQQQLDARAVQIRELTQEVSEITQRLSRYPPGNFWHTTWDLRERHDAICERVGAEWGKYCDRCIAIDRHHIAYGQKDPQGREMIQKQYPESTGWDRMWHWGYNVCCSRCVSGSPGDCPLFDKKADWYPDPRLTREGQKYFGRLT